MKVTRYLWISHLPRHCQEHHIQSTFQSHGKIQTIRIHENNNSKGAIVAFIDCKSSTKAFESVKTLMNMPLKLEYCEANGEPGIVSLGLSNEGLFGDTKVSRKSGSNKTIDSRSRSSSSNTSSFGSSLDDCAKYPPLQMQKRPDVEEGRSSCSEESGEKRRGPGEEGGAAAEGLEAEGLHEDMRGLLVENLSQRSSDTSLREGLFHEYKKHGKITSVAVMGQGGARHAVISFKRPEDMAKALEASAAKTFFGQLIKVRQHHGYNYVDPDLCPPEHAMDEYHPKATKTLFVGKLCTGAVAEHDLAKVFRKYGEIIDIDIKTQSNQPDTSFAFVQYFDISSVVRALRCQDSIKVDGKPVKLGFGKSQPANCLWVGNLQRSANDTFLRRHFKRYGAVMLVIPDQEYNCALVQFEAAEDALRAFTDTRERSNNSTVPRRMQVDYASNEYQMAFMNRLRKSCQLDTQDFLKNITDPYQTEKIQNLLISYTKYLGLLDETRTRAYDRYEPKSDYEDYDEFYNARPSRQRKTVHQRLYNESYGVDEEYSDDYHYSKPKPRHFENFSSSRSPARYPRTSQKYINDQFGPQDCRRPNYQHYPNDYYEPKVEPSSSTYYPYRRSPDPNFTHSNHNRSYTPSPTSSLDYCDDYPRYNLSPKRYSKSNKEFHINRPRPLDLHDPHEEHFSRTSETKNWLKPPRRDLEEGYTAFRSKSKSKLSTSLSPHVKNTSARVRLIKNEPTKKSRVRKNNNNNNNEEGAQPPSVSKVVPSTGNTNNKVPSGNVKTKTSTNGPSTNISSTDSIKLPPELGSVPSVVQPVDALSKLERERAKLLEELSLLSEDSLGTPLNMVLKTVKTSPKIVHEEALKSQKKGTSPRDILDKAPSSLTCVTEKKTVKAEKIIVKVEPKVPESKPKVIDVATNDKTMSLEKSPASLIAPAASSQSSSDTAKTLLDNEHLSLKTDVLTVEATSVIMTSPSLPSLDFSNLSRDPRLNSSSLYIRPLSSSSISPTSFNLPVISTTTVPEPVITPLQTSCSYKDSTSDSDMDPFSITDFDVDKRIRELDAKISRSEQTVRTLDYSKFRIRKKDSGSLTCVTTTVSVHSSPSYLMVSPSSSMVSPSSLLDVGYSNINRDSGSNTSEFIKSMLNQTKQKSYHLSDSSTDHKSSLCSNYSIVSTTCSSFPFRTVDLGANDIERRSFYSRFGSTSSSCSPYVDTKLNVETSMLSPIFTSFSSKLPTTTTTSTITSSKVSASLVVSPTTTINTVSAPNTPNGIDSNQPMKSILKKSNLSLNSSIKHTNKLPECLVVPKVKIPQDSASFVDCINNKSNDLKEVQPKKSSSVTVKRKAEDDDIKKHFKRIKNDNGPVLDDTLFQSYPTMPTKKLKKTSKKSSQTSLDVKPLVTNKLLLSPNISVISEKCSAKKIENLNNKKTSKTFTGDKKSNLSSSKKSKLKQKSTSKLTQSQMRNGKSKSNKLEKNKKITKCKKERMSYESRLCEEEDDDDMEEEVDRVSDNDDDNDNDSESTNSDDYESMYDKIKRRKSKSNKINGDIRRKQSFGKKRRNDVEFTGGSSDNLDSEDSEYWSMKSMKRSSHQKRKRPRMSEMSGSHFSDSNSCKTASCGKSSEIQQHSSERYEAKCGIKMNEDIIKDESVTDESKAPAESFNLSSPHNSSQCSSPKYVKEMSMAKGIVVSCGIHDQSLSQGVQSYRGKSLHRPNDGPLKKRPITEPIVLSEDLPFLEKQAEEEYIVSSPTSFNDEPPSQLESMYDIPSTHQTNVLEEIVLDDHHHSSDVIDVEFSIQENIQCDVQEQDDSILPSDVDSASHILLTMKSQPALEVEYASSVITNEPDHQLQSVAEHLISLAQNKVEGPINISGELPATIHEEEKVEAVTKVVENVPTKVSPNVKQDDEVTIYVKNIIDRIKQETDLASSLNKEKLAYKRAKKASTFNIPLSKPMMVNNVGQDCRHILPLDNDTISRLASATITTTQPLSLASLPSTCVMITNNQIVEQSIHYPKSQSSRSSQGEEKRSVHSDEANSTCSTDKRIRHNSAKSDGQLQSLDETIDNVVKGSISSSASDAVSVKSVTDVDESKSMTNSYESTTMVKGDFTALEETMNEVINKLSVPSPCSIVTSYLRGPNDVDNGKCNINAVRPMFNNEMNRQKKITMNHVKPSVYQLTNNVGGITNLVLGIPSILTVNTLVSQQNALNHMVSFQNSVSGQNKLSNQLTLPLNKVSVSSLQCNPTSSGSSQLIQSLSLTPNNINIQSIQQHNQATNLGVQSSDMLFTKLNSLTPIMIQAPLRNITSLGQNNNMLNQSIISHRPTGNTMNATFVSIAAGSPACNISTDASCAKFISVSLTPSINKPITTPINVVPRAPLNTQGLNLTKISTSSLDPNYYLMMQRQTNQSKSKGQNICQSSPTDINVSGLTAGHSIILSQLSHSVNSVLSPITPAYLAASMNRPNAGSITLQPLSTSNGIVTTSSVPTSSMLFRPLNIPFRKFEERDDWLKQSTQSEFNYPIRWTGKLCLKNDEVFVQMHMLAGNEDLIRNSMNLISSGQDSSQPLRIVQRMRLEPNQLEGLQRRLARQLEFCTCLTLAGGDKPDELGRTSSALQDNFINYLREKSAAGIINICVPDSQQNAYVIHIFPPCDFSDNQLRTCSSKLYDQLKEQEVPYLVIVITTV